MSRATGIDISICVANFNGGDLVLDCLASVYAQQGPFSFEVLVHDDASTDGSLARIRATFPQLTVIASEENAGFCVSNNRMADAASGRYFLFLNNDAILRPGSLDRLFALAESRPRAALLGLPQFALSDGQLVDRGYRTDPFLNPIPMFGENIHPAGVVTGACLWVPRSTWEEIGGFPPWFESVAEDIFLCVAARLLGYPILAVDAPGFDHWIGRNLGGGKTVAGKLETTIRRRRLSERNKTFTMLCCYGPMALVCLLPLHFAFLSLEAIALLLSGAGSKTVGAIYASIPGEVYRKRHEIANLRRRLMSRRPRSGPSVFRFTDWIPYKLLMLLRHGMPHLR